MSAPWTCGRLQESAAELALGLAVGPDRADALAHLERCDACRALVGDLTRVVDHLLVTGPVAEPPSGFEGRVLERLGDATVAAGGAVPVVDPATRRRTRRSADPRRVVALRVLALAAVLLVGFAAGAVIVGRRSPAGSLAAAVREAPMITPTGQNVGKVDVGGTPDTIFVTLPKWYVPNAPEPRYRLRLALTDGSHLDLGPVKLWEGGTWGGTTTVDPAKVRSVSLLDSSGRELCHAHLTDA